MGERLNGRRQQLRILGRSAARLRTACGKRADEHRQRYQRKRPTMKQPVIDTIAFSGKMEFG